MWNIWLMFSPWGRLWLWVAVWLEWSKTSLILCMILADASSLGWSAHCSVFLPYFCALLALRSPPSSSSSFAKLPGFERCSSKKKEKKKKNNRKKTDNRFHIALFKGHDKLRKIHRRAGDKGMQQRKPARQAGSPPGRLPRRDGAAVSGAHGVGSPSPGQPVLSRPPVPSRPACPLPAIPPCPGPPGAPCPWCWAAAPALAPRPAPAAREAFFLQVP